VNSFKIVLRIVFIIYYYVKIIKVIITESRATLIILHLLVIPMEQANRKYIYFYFYNYTTRTFKVTYVYFILKLSFWSNY
jgi:hypothetical protein